MTVREFLESQGLSAFSEVFDANHVRIEDLPGMTDAELRDTFGMTAFGDRKRFRAAVAALADSSSDPLAGATVAGTEPASRGDALAGATRAGTVNAGPVPQRLGSYRVLGVVGAGGMGTVVRARHAEEGWASRQGGDVAIKLVHAHLASDATFRERFFSEADLGRRMQHASLVPTWDVVTEGAWLGTVMSFVEGEPLTSRVRAGGLAVEEVVRLLGPVGEALDHLHAHGVVHRDVKPANVVVRPDGRPVLLDLGIAKDTGSGEGHTRTMTTMGTSLWMAPEQADAKHVDGAADRYALGLMAYVLLSGRMPWEHGTSEARVLVAKMTGQLGPLGEARPGLPAHVTDAVTRMVALAPGDRFASCGQFITALQHEAPSSAQRLEDASGVQSITVCEAGEGHDEAVPPASSPASSPAAVIASPAAPAMISRSGPSSAAPAASASSGYEPTTSTDAAASSRRTSAVSPLVVGAAVFLLFAGGGGVRRESGGRGWIAACDRHAARRGGGPCARAIDPTGARRGCARAHSHRVDPAARCAHDRRCSGGTVLRLWSCHATGRGRNLSQSGARSLG